MRRGFTLVELLIVVAIIAVLAVVVFVALNPLQRFQDARDSQRSTDVTAILDAVKLDQVDNGGTYISAVSSLTDDAYYAIGTCSGSTSCGAVAEDASACADLSGLVDEGYLANVPTDPSTGDATNTDYYIQKRAEGTVAVGACDPEGGTAIEVAR